VDKNFCQFFKAQVEKNRERVYLIDAVADSKITYGEADAMSSKLANYFVSKGITKTDIITTVLGNTLDYIYIFIAAAKIGVLFNPLFFKLREEEVDALIKEVKPALIIDESNVKQVMQDAHSFPDTFEEVDQVSMSQEMLLLHSSGTTGKPKGIVLTQKNVFACVEGGAKAVGFEDGKVLFNLLPLSFSGGLIPSLFATLYTSCTAIITPWFDVETFWQIVEKYNVNYLYIVPTMIQMLLKNAEQSKKYDISSVEFCISAADTLTTDLFLAFKKAFNITLYNFYGTSDTMGIAVQTEGELKQYSVGKPVDNVEVNIVDDKGKRLLHDEVGEIIVRGPGIMKEYFNMPELTKETIRDGWFYTGDLGYLDSEGILYFKGRRKHIIIKGGMNIDPLEISNVFLKHAQVEDAAAIGIPDEKFGEEIAVFVVGDVDEKELQTFAEEHFSSFKMPKVIKIIDSIPKTQAGKVKKEALAKLS